MAKPAGRLRAFKVAWDGMAGTEAVYAETSAGRARYRAYLQLLDIRRDVNITQFRVKRAPVYDPYVIKPGALTQIDRHVWDYAGLREAGLWDNEG